MLIASWGKPDHKETIRFTTHVNDMKMASCIDSMRCVGVATVSVSLRQFEIFSDDACTVAMNLYLYKFLVK